VIYQAERLLCGRKGEVLLFHPWDPESPAFDNPEAADRYLKGVQERLTSAGAQAIRRIIRSGPVARTLPETVESEKASLVALASHGRDTSPHQSVGDVVEEVLKASPVPLFVARSYRPGAAGDPVPSECEVPSFGRILVPLDGSSACEAVMPYARELGRLLQARIIVLHVSGEMSPEPDNFWGRNLSGEPLGPTPGEDATAEQRVEFAARTFSEAGLETLAMNVGGEPITAILEFARPSAVDLIAMTTHGRTGLAKLLMGSVAQKVLREALLPTLVVRSDALGAAGCAAP